MYMPHKTGKQAPLRVGLVIGLIAGFAITSRGKICILLGLGTFACWLIALRSKVFR